METHHPKWKDRWKLTIQNGKIDGNSPSTVGTCHVWMTKTKKPGIDSAKRTDERSACFLPRAKRVEVDKLTNFFLK